MDNGILNAWQHTWGQQLWRVITDTTEISVGVTNWMNDKPIKTHPHFQDVKSNVSHGGYVIVLMWKCHPVLKWLGIVAVFRLCTLAEAIVYDRLLCCLLKMRLFSKEFHEHTTFKTFFSFGKDVDRTSNQYPSYLLIINTCLPAATWAKVQTTISILVLPLLLLWFRQENCVIVRGAGWRTGNSGGMRELAAWSGWEVTLICCIAEAQRYYCAVR